MSEPFVLHPYLYDQLCTEGADMSQFVKGPPFIAFDEAKPTATTEGVRKVLESLQHQDHPAYTIGLDGHGYIYGVRVTE